VALVTAQLVRTVDGDASAVAVGFDPGTLVVGAVQIAGDDSLAR